MAYDLKEPVWNGNIDREEIRDADEDEQMTQIYLTRFSGRYYEQTNGDAEVLELYGNDICEAPDDTFCVENCCSFEKIDSCYCGFDKNKYSCILTPCCRHKMHLRCLYAWKEKKQGTTDVCSGREAGIEHCPYCRANWEDYGNGLYPPQ